MSKLKSILLIAIVIVACHAVQAQVAEIQEYAQVRVNERTFDAAFIGCDGTRAVYVENASTRKKQKTELVAYTMDRAELVRLTLTEGTDTRCYGGFINGQYVDLLMADWKGDDMTLYRDRRDLQTLQPVGERLTLADYKGTSGDKMAFRLASSPNQKLLALMYYVGRETQATEVQVGLYSRELEEYWKVDTKVRSTSMFHLTDSGEVALGGMTGQGCKVTIVDGETEKEYLIPKDDLPTNTPEMSLARIADGKIYIVATQRIDSKDYIPALNGTQVDKVVSLCYDTKRNATSTHAYKITDQDRARMIGVKDDYKWKKNDWKCVQFFSLNQTMVDRDGYYAMMDQMWTVTVDGVLSCENRTGQMVMRVDNDGAIEWVRVFRMSQTAPAKAMPMIHYRWVSTPKGPMLLWVEAKKSAEYPEEKPVVDFETFKTSGVITAALIGRDGKLVRQHWPLPGRTGLQGRPVLMENGKWLILQRDRSKGKFLVFSL